MTGSFNPRELPMKRLYLKPTLAKAVVTLQAVAATISNPN